MGTGSEKDERLSNAGSDMISFHFHLSNEHYKLNAMSKTRNNLLVISGVISTLNYFFIRLKGV